MVVKVLMLMLLNKHSTNS